MKKNYKKNIALGIVIILLDQITKIILIDKYITVIPKFLKFTYTMNKGAAFGLGTPVIVLIINILIVIGVFIFVYKYRNKISNYIPITMILAGGIGNLIDRIFRGFVVDFIDVNLFNFPNFNIADISICLGSIILIFVLWKDDKSNKENKKKPHGLNKQEKKYGKNI